MYNYQISANEVVSSTEVMVLLKLKTDQEQHAQTSRNTWR